MIEGYSTREIHSKFQVQIKNILKISDTYYITVQLYTCTM
jgi:hypothetical protein